MKPSKQIAKDILVSFSLINLCFIRVWYPLVIPAGSFYQARLPRFSDYFALLTLVFACSLFGALLIAKLRKASIRARYIAAGLGVLLAIYLTDRLQLSLFKSEHAQTILLLTLVVLGFFSRKFSRISLKIAYAGLLVLSVFWIYCGIRAPFLLQAIHRGPGQAHEKGLLDPAAKSRQKIIWVLFDELDPAYVYDAAQGFKLQSLRKGFENAFYTGFAIAPTNRTVNSVLSYLLSEQVVEVKPVSANVALLRIDGQAAVPFKPEGTIFEKLWQKGYKIGISGWHLPYCRLFEKYASECAQFGSSKYNNVTSSDYVEALWMDLHSLLPDWASFQHGYIYKKSWESSEWLLRNKSLDFIYLHFSVPHLPRVANGESERFAAFFDSTQKAYESNLSLVDESIDRIREILASEGEWDRSILIITSDHWWRTPERLKNRHFQVPLLIRLPWEEEKRISSTPFSNILISDIILALSKSEITDYAGLSNWIDGHQAQYPLNPNLGD